MNHDSQLGIFTENEKLQFFVGVLNVDQRLELIAGWRVQSRERF